MTPSPSPHENLQRLAELEAQLLQLVLQQQTHNQKLMELNRSIAELKKKLIAETPAPQATEIRTPTPQVNPTPVQPITEAHEPKKSYVASDAPPPINKARTTSDHNNVEKFLGENLINKVGIVILLLGVGWGVKYSIDNQLISPLARVIMGYIASAGLFGLAYYLKTKYENYSAVLLSGSLAMMYFITYFAFSSYGIFGRIPAFALMLVFTIVTVAESLRYNRVIIAHIGLVGAYAVPFLLSDGSGNIKVLFSYMAIINAGILFIALKRYWKSLWYSSFIFTILICFGWLIKSYSSLDHIIGLLFLPLFFLLHLASFLAFKLSRHIPYHRSDNGMLYLNSVLFFIATMFVADHYAHGPLLLTLSFIATHSIIGYLLYRKGETHHSLAHQFFGLAIAFVAVVITVQWDEEWTTLGWSLQAMLLAYYASKTGNAVYRNLCQGILVLAIGSMFYDWSVYYADNYYGKASYTFTPVLNFHFIASCICSALLVASSYFILRKQSLVRNLSDSWKHVLLIGSSVVIALYGLYGTFYHEINHYWSQMLLPDFNTGAMDIRDYAIHQQLLQYRGVWLIHYTLLFVSVINVFLMRLYPSKAIQQIAMAINGMVVLLFLTTGLSLLSELRDSYMKSIAYSSTWNLMIRYFGYAFVALLLVTCYRFIQNKVKQAKYQMAFDILLHITYLWILSAELLHWRDLNHSGAADKTGLSILWGAYALFLIAIGIVQKKSYLRIAALVWIGVTLIKLFFYDLSELSTISKTIVLVILGAVLLIISFLYNKYKAKIFGDEG
jgi:uncharacterized membrane protein